METSYNIPLVVLSFVVSVVGSFMALLINRDALKRAEDRRGGFVLMAALCLGGVGIWSMHFIGMLAFNIKGMPISYDWGITALSFLVGVAVVWIGLRIMSKGQFGFFKLVLSGTFVGLGVAVMHYTGMWAMHMQSTLHWNPTIVAVSLGIAVTAAIVALWLAAHVEHLWQIVVSALVMGVAVCGMHYTGMAAASFEHTGDMPLLSSAKTSSSTVLVSSIIFVDFLVALLASTIAMAEANKHASR